METTNNEQAKLILMFIKPFRQARPYASMPKELQTIAILYDMLKLNFVQAAILEVLKTNQQN